MFRRQSATSFHSCAGKTSANCLSLWFALCTFSLVSLWWQRSVYWTLVWKTHSRLANLAYYNFTDIPSRFNYFVIWSEKKCSITVNFLFFGRAECLSFNSLTTTPHPVPPSCGSASSSASPSATLMVWKLLTLFFRRITRLLTLIFRGSFSANSVLQKN